jgi:hypothetical protein
VKAKILDGSLQGVEFEISNETVKNLEEQKRIKSIPNDVRVGQIYKISSTKFMIASTGQVEYNEAGLTIIGSKWGSCGCYDSSICIGHKPYKQLRKILLEKKATYLGTFNEIFKEIN